MAFMRIPLLPQREMTVEEFKAWLRHFDADHDGRLTREELQRALHSLTGWSAWWQARRGMKRADADGDGYIDADEMDGLVRYAKQNLHIRLNYDAD